MSVDAATVGRPARTTARRRAALAGAGLLSAAMLGSGLLVYAFHLLAARALGADAYGGIAVLWAALFLVVIVVFRPLEQTISRSMAARRARGEETRTVVRSTAAVAAVAIAVVVAVGAGAWDAIRDGLFAGDAVLTGALLAGTAAYGVSYVVRGVLAGAGWYGGYALFLLADAVTLLLVSAPLVLGAPAATAAAAIVAAAAVGAAVPLLVGRRRLAHALAGDAGTRFRLGSALTFAGPAGVVAVADQLLVNGGPLLVMLEGGAIRTAGLVFAATMLVRVSVYLFQGVAVSLLPNLTRIHVVEVADLPRAALQVVVLLLGTSAVIVLGAAVAGPDVMTLLYGAEFHVGRTPLVVLGVGVGGYLAAASCSQALLAADAGRTAAIAWAGAGAVFAVVFHAADGDELTRVAAAFTSASFTAFALLGTGLALLTRRAGALAS